MYIYSYEVKFITPYHSFLFPLDHSYKLFSTLRLKRIHPCLPSVDMSMFPHSDPWPTWT